ncbi:HD domain-containing protein [Bdellovibrio sp. HCB2-146]|uniref:[protein-PII] uridylyltransferase family protein n=1 Tax=Bdellovibrio sp. HCB2-146 TaxID=3394362 RepID=UPI0039BCFD02
MANKSFLSSDKLQLAQEILNPPLMTPDGDVRKISVFSSQSFSHWLEAELEERMQSHPEWKEIHPILLGSWARGELAPKSDIDLLFCGDEALVKSFVDKVQEQGLKLRYRVPQDPQDWTVGVEAFDVLALLKARPLTAEGAKKLYEQQRRIWSKKKTLRTQLLKAVKKERSERASRYDSITNYLEPNIKYGPGSLRDLEQGLQIYDLFAEKFVNPAHALDVLKYYRQYLLGIRQKLHLEGMGDILVSTSQFDMAKWLGFKSHKDFMRDLQRGLSRVNFYSDWIVAVAESSEAELKKTERSSFKKPADLSLALHKNSNVLVQKKVREHLDELFPEKNLKKNAKLRGDILKKVLDIKASDEFLVSVFRSRLIDKLVPEFLRLVGWVQHDQYHRFTADSHIMQACREVKRLYRKPSSLGPLKFLHAKLTSYDWQVLSWSCLYHDLAKGLEGHDHSEAGVKFVQSDFKSFGFSKQFTDDVKWMVKNHLELSQAAFRKNSKDPKVWQELRLMGVEGAALNRLALFTAVDIRATNPEAWNDWKASLLKELVLNLESKKAEGFFHFYKFKNKKGLSLPLEIFEELGLSLIESISVEELSQDLLQAEKSETDLQPKILKTKKGETWVRFHQKRDRKGVLVDYVTQLYSLGLGVRHASIHTLPKVGVYDWFQLQTTKSPQQITQLLKANIKSKELPHPKFDQIQWVSADDKEWVLSFKGPDQSGLLAAATKALSDLDLSIRGAQVHTWGRQVDDVFFLRASSGIERTAVIEKLQKDLGSEK